MISIVLFRKQFADVEAFEDILQAFNKDLNSESIVLNAVTINSDNLED